MAIQGKRKALLIGIAESSQDKSQLLRGPHRDAPALGELLKEHGYKVTLMLDKPQYHPELIPNHDNIIREMRSLVKGARPGDRFVFLYSGHSTQVDQPEDKVEKEVDLKDEAIIPVDGKIIIDDVLNNCLVKPLPSGSNLVAIFDTCHSGSMLDLPHAICNKETFKICEGFNVKTKKSLSRKSSVRLLPPTSTQSIRVALTSHSSSSRGNVHITIPASPATFSDLTNIVSSPIMSPVSLHRDYFYRAHEPSHLRGPPQRKSTFDAHFTATVTMDKAPVRRSLTHPDVLLSSVRQSGGAHVTFQTSRRPSTDILFASPGHSQTPSRSSTLGSEGSVDSNGVPRLTISKSFPSFYECKGGCTDSPTERANVVSFSSCSDPETSLEDPTGYSMTAMMIDILKNNPRPRMKDMMLEITNRFFVMSSMARDIYHANKKPGFPVYRTADFRQEPQISSLKPLHEDVRLEL